MEWLLPLIIGLLAGAIIAWLIGRQSTRDALALAREQLQQKENLLVQRQEALHEATTAKVKAESELVHAQESLVSQQQFVEQLKQQMPGEFKSVSSHVIKETLREAKETLDERKQAIDDLLTPLKQSLKDYKLASDEIEKERQKAYGEFKNELQHVANHASSLSQATRNLVTALRRSHVRGRWGEVQLKNAAEIAGMSQYCDFLEQAVIPDGDKKWRPDMTVRLPGDRVIYVDSKVPFEAFLDYTEAQTDDSRDEALRRHANQLKDHVDSLAKQEYWKQNDQSADFAVMFVPVETMFLTALAIDANLYENSLKRNVIITTPATFIALLRTAALNWRQESLSRNALQIHALGSTLYDRVAVFLEHIQKMGRKLRDANEEYNSAASSFKSRLTPQMQKFREFGVASKREIPELTEIDITPVIPGDDGN